MVLSTLSQSRTTDPQAMATQCQLLVYYADSIYENQEYKRAEVFMIQPSILPKVPVLTVLIIVLIMNID